MISTVGCLDGPQSQRGSHEHLENQAKDLLRAEHWGYSCRKRNTAAGALFVVHTFGHPSVKWILLDQNGLYEFSDVIFPKSKGGWLTRVDVFHLVRAAKFVKQGM